ncbi:MAG: hypothetical protein LW853_06490 [Rickettsiales bacterium]|jgi:hypothetical protein|nr:hypothetical protein [Rickettsiales bacterium]
MRSLTLTKILSCDGLRQTDQSAFYANFFWETYFGKSVFSDAQSVKVVVKTVLDAPVERIWTELKTPALLRFVAAPLVIFDLIDSPSLPLQ